MTSLATACATDADDRAPVPDPIDADDRAPAPDRTGLVTGSAAAVVGACGSTQTISSVTASVAQDGNPASNAIDGDGATRWSGKGVGASILADLGASQEVCSVNVAWYQGDTRASTFSISLSSDGVRFTQAYAGVSARTAGIEGYQVRPTQARYVRLVVNGNTANDWASVTELQVSAFVLRQTKPTASNTGAGIIRPYPTAVINGNVTLSTANAQLRDTIVHGRVIIKAANVVVSNVVVDGGPAEVSGFMIDTGSATNARIEFTTVRPLNPTHNTNGIGPREFVASRVDVSGVVDAFDTFGKSVFMPVNVAIEGSYAHDLSHFSPDSNHPNDGADSRTHNDIIQSHGGGGLRVIGSNLSAYHDQTLGTQPTPHPNHQLAAVMINNLVGPSRDLLFEDNWLGGGEYCVNAGGAPGASATFLRNRFDRGSKPGAKPDETFTLVFHTEMTQVSIGNVYEDNGHPIRVRQ